MYDLESLNLTGCGGASVELPVFCGAAVVEGDTLESSRLLLLFIVRLSLSSVAVVLASSLLLSFLVLSNGVDGAFSVGDALSLSSRLLHLGTSKKLLLSSFENTHVLVPSDGFLLII